MSTHSRPPSIHPAFPPTLPLVDIGRRQPIPDLPAVPSETTGAIRSTLADAINRKMMGRPLGPVLR